MLFAVIPTRDRPAHYSKCVEAIRSQVDDLVTVAHLEPYYALGSIVPYSDDPPNISTMWALGLRRCEELSRDRDFYAAILNDDVVVPQGWLSTILQKMEEEGTVLGSGRAPYLRKEALCGPAFVLKGRTIVPNEKYDWWASDDWIAEEAVKNWGGKTWISDLRVKHAPGKGNVPADPRLHKIAERNRMDWLRRSS